MAFEFNDSFFNKLHSAMREAIIEARKQDRIDNYKEIYLSKIGSYVYMTIDEIDKDIHSSRISEYTGNNTIQSIKNLLQEEYKKLETIDNSSILLTLQENEYQFRKKINTLKEGVYR